MYSQINTKNAQFQRQLGENIYSDLHFAPTLLEKFLNLSVVNVCTNENKDYLKKPYNHVNKFLNTTLRKVTAESYNMKPFAQNEKHVKFKSMHINYNHLQKL